MSARRLSTVAAAVLSVHAAVAAAQPVSHPPGPQPVSPGSFTKATLAAACPSFSWAPMPWAAAYELTVFAIEDAGLAAAPALEAGLPGAAASWTPPVSDCLEPGSEYMWFIREVDGAGEPVGAWSNGMRFSVAATSPRGTGGTHHGTADGAGEPPEANEASGTAGEPGPSGSRVQITANDGNGDGSSKTPPTNREILAKLEQVLAELRAPEPAFSFALCTEPAFQGEVEAGQQMVLNGTLEGRVGAEGFGNGGMIRLKGEPAAVFEGQFKGAWDILKFGVCWDIGATVRNRRAAQAAAGGVTRAAALDGGDLADVVAGLDLADIQARLQALADRLNLDPRASLEALQDIGDLSLDDGPFGALREDGPFQRLAGSLPLPEQLRKTLQDPGALVAQFQTMRTQGLCSLDLPPALSGPIGEICNLIQNEPYSKLLTRVDNVVGDVNGTVDDIKSVVDNIRGRLPIEGDCKLFCK